MIRTQVQLTEEQAQALKNLASARQVSIAELIRQSVETLIRSSGTIDAAERRRRAIAAAGRFHSGAAVKTLEDSSFLLAMVDRNDKHHTLFGTDGGGNGRHHTA